MGNPFPSIRPKIKEHPDDARSPYSPVSAHDIGFCLVSAPSNGRKNIMSVMTCRDYINDAMLKFHQPKNFDFSYYNCEIPIDWNRLRLGLFCKKGVKIEETHEKLLFAKKIINIYEKIGKFSRFSTLTKADYDGKAEAWLLTGPKEWMKTSHLVSMVTLIFRMVQKSNLQEKKKINNIKDIHDFFLEIRKDKNKLGGDYYYSERFSMFELFMKKYRQLFDIPQEVLFPKHIDYSWHTAGGISSLCSYLTYIKGLDEKVEKEWKTWNLGK